MRSVEPRPEVGDPCKAIIENGARIVISLIAAIALCDQKSGFQYAR